MLDKSIKSAPARSGHVGTSMTANDNAETPMSALRWREQDEIKQRITDLKWQANYALFQLKRWRNLENDQWTSLRAMHVSAADELAILCTRYLN